MSKPKKRALVTPQLAAEIRKARATGMHLVDVAARFGVAKSTVERAVRGGVKEPLPVFTKRAETEMEDINLRIKELKERKKQLQSRNGLRVRLLQYCQRHQLSRADLIATIDRLPLIRITKKHREAQAK
jgi:hypothetical protein